MVPRVIVASEILYYDPDGVGETGATCNIQRRAATHPRFLRGGASR
ncbi:MAG: hypothetical protein R3D34_05335 [Nitratireductor sp.]